MYADSAKVSWPPAKIFGDEITILGSFSETFMFRKFLLVPCLGVYAFKRGVAYFGNSAATIDYLDSGKVKTKGIVNKVFKLEDFGKALDSIRDKSAIKAAIVFE